MSVFLYLQLDKKLDNIMKFSQVVCIYKITSPTGKVYIGQTINARRRYTDYKSKKANKQPFLHKSIIKHGWHNHQFEVVHELPSDVTQDVINNYECIYIELYRSAGAVLLNTKEGGSNGRNSDESIKKANDKWKEWYNSNPVNGIKWIIQSIEARRGVPLTKEHRQKLSQKLKGRIVTEEHARNLSLATKGKPKKYKIEDTIAQSMRAKKIGGWNKKPIVQMSLTGEFIKEWPSGTKAAKELGVSRKGIERCLKKQRGGKTYGGFTWRYK